MKTNTTAAEVLMITLVLAPLAYVALIWNELPTEIATHYTISGKPDGWMRKENAALFLGVLSVFLYLVLRYLPNIDPKGHLQTANFLKMRVLITLFFSAINGLVFYMAAHQSDKNKLISSLLALTALLIAGLGNYMTTVKPNYFVGIRTPWTLQSDAVWRKTHQMGGRWMVAGGLLSAVLVFVVPMPYTVGVVVGIILLSTIIPVVYSYIYFRQEKARQLS
ncbi:SdpI family protein [Spirosoma spitsbergense]|jgi:uncharacterized membrane protein|uniref:SdpI family protein n=1 Tax=Spirosoma spitsbergense TaxID=431554 RepID=UPI00035ECC66|nr:SdpI family protein [Spirosoma spitsbergense]